MLFINWHEFLFGFFSFIGFFISLGLNGFLIVYLSENFKLHPFWLIIISMLFFIASIFFIFMFDPVPLSSGTGTSSTYIFNGRIISLGTNITDSESYGILSVLVIIWVLCFISDVREKIKDFFKKKK